MHLRIPLNMFLWGLLLAAAAIAEITPANFQRALDTLSRLAAGAANSTQVPGISYAVIYQDKVYTNAYGVRKIGGNDAVTADTVFQLASVSKPLSATAVAAFITQGKTAWNASLNTPSFTVEYADPYVTNELLLSDGFSHRSGLLGPAGEDLELAGFSRQTILSRLRYAPQSGPFRITYSYSNYGLTAAAVSAAKATGQDWETAADDYLISPLRMSSTSYRGSDFLSQSNRATLHYPTPGPNRTWIAAEHRNPDAQAPAGGASSNVVDLAKWVQMLLADGKLSSGDTLLTEDALNNMTLPQIVRGVHPTTGKTGFYAHGWDIDYKDEYTYVGHAGAFEQGVRSLVKYNLEAKIGFVGVTNCFPTGWPEGLADTLFDIALYGESRQDWPAVWNSIYSYFDAFYTSNPYAFSPPNSTTPSLGLDTYVGAYANNYVGTARISWSSGRRRNNDGTGLVLTFDDSNKTYPLKHWDRDTFLINGTQPSQNSAAIFSLGPDGKTAATLMLTQFAGNQGDILQRVASG